MGSVKAQLNTYRQSPRKVRAVADLVRGKSVAEALDILAFAPKKAAAPLKKLIQSAVANAKSLGVPTDDLHVKTISVDGGAILYRRRPRAHGVAYAIRKRTSHVKVVLEGKK